MVQTASTMMLPLGSQAPAFALPDPQGRVHSLEDLRSAPVLVVAFLCNHCPFVKHVQQGFSALAREYREKGVAVVAINSNDAEAYPDDSPERMAEEAERAGYAFPYLFDGSQEVAKAYRAACTPDFFVFDGDRRLTYRGQMDGSRPGNEVPVTGADLRGAIDAALAGKPAPPDQKPSVGCNIKWKPGNGPAWFPG